MEDFCQGDGDRFVLLVVLHNAVIHVIPLFPHNGVLRQGAGCVVVRQLLESKEGLRLRIAIDAIVADACFAQSGNQFGPDRMVPLLVFFDITALQFHLEGVSNHCGSFL
jgi:hypothetical protein